MLGKWDSNSSTVTAAVKGDSKKFWSKILKGVEGYQDCEIIYVASEQAKKVVKKLRFRNFPSIALFFDGSKKETWKADMDGDVDCSAKEIKSAIDNMLAEDVF